MKARHLLKDSLLERQSFQSRALIAFCVTFFIILSIIARFTFLQIIHHSEYQTQSDANRIKLRPLAPNRGLIYDRNGILIAQNTPVYQLQLIPEQIDDLENTLTQLAEIISVSSEEIDQFHKLRKHRRNFQASTLKIRLSEREMARFSVNQYRFPGVEISPQMIRYYPYKDLLTHVLGYVGRIDADDLNNLDTGNYAASNHTGKLGVEKFYEKQLHGTTGYEQIETNAQGRVVRFLNRKQPVPGEDIRLSIDLDIQKAAQEALGGYTGAVVAIEPASGKVIAMVSLPSYNPNPFVNGVTYAQYQTLLNSELRPLFNRALKGRYEPGSTLKPFIALAGLQTGIEKEGHTFDSRGYYQLPGQPRKYHDWKRGGHGKVNLQQAITESVNVYFYDLAFRLGIDAIHANLGTYGFGKRTGIDLFGENPGLLPSREWKRNSRNLPWFPGETVITGIGQGFTLVTPLQMARNTAFIANRGSLPQVRLRIDDTPNKPPIPVPMVDNSNHWDTIIAGMMGVLHGAKGTARSSGKNLDYKIAGKSGTSQVFGLAENEKYVASELPLHLRDHALFIAFAPAENPSIAVSVVVEHGGGGSRNAAPVARKVIDAWLDKQAKGS